jgi:arginase family enzyme
LGPAAIRHGLRRVSTYDIESGIDLATFEVADLGQVDLYGLRASDAIKVVQDASQEAFDHHLAVLFLGGDNALTEGVVKGLARNANDWTNLGVLTLDAHLDVRHRNDGIHNGNPIRGLLDAGLPGENLVQIGIASFANSFAYGSDVRRAGGTVITASQARAQGLSHCVGEQLAALSLRARWVYVDFDLDVLDRTFVPGCPGARPGGFAPYEVLEAARVIGRCEAVRGFDLVELDPEQDFHDQTALLAGQLLLAFASGFYQRC